ncbi:hypothetical protein GCM10010954_30200 [Halobacillus andaensis]|uniref:Uncharacterized protein n=1 Tax=Halobacillus andaensis TaxID=1176239 RepID=A0A917B960_HALAA|nr:hypothetical protein [Halobacillus andaensis]MBP2005125.1 hypothetical protein [Halobacillus andaensis]GGF29046.1 hypothetical protein GCM10010954_30200 [Halobacillus andaensis]
MALKLLHTLKSDGYSKVTFDTENEGKRVFLQLDELVSEEQLLNILKVNPKRVEYFPLEEKPYMIVHESDICTRFYIDPKKSN